MLRFQISCILVVTIVLMLMHEGCCTIKCGSTMCRNYDGTCDGGRILGVHGNQNKEKKRWLLWPSAQKYSQSNTLAQLKKSKLTVKTFVLSEVCIHCSQKKVIAHSCKDTPATEGSDFEAGLTPP